MTYRQALSLMVLSGVILLLAQTPVTAQLKKSGEVVKVRATATKPGADGSQTVTIQFDIEPKYHIYANPVGNPDFESNQTKISITSKGKLDVNIQYPEGELVQDKVVGNYRIYQGKFSVKAIVKRASGATDPLEVSVKVQACTKTSCLPDSTIKVRVEE
jgi:thiol:disulfide interchange protein